MVKFELVFVVWMFVDVQVGAHICPNTSTNRETKPLYVLTLLSLPGGLSLLSGHRIALDEINNRTDLLPGYHIELIVDTIEGCSSLEAGVGLSNLLKYTVNPQCRPVVAVAGLVCSSHTSVLSPVASHDEFSLIQLSAANSPIFETQNNRFPHLWRFLGSAIVYSDTVLAIMDQYNWTRIGIVYNIESVFHSKIASNLEQKITSHSTRSIIFNVGLRDTQKLYLDTAISNIKDLEATVLVSLLTTAQTEALLLETLQHGLTYPQHTWIHVEKLQIYFKSNPAVFNATRGHIYLHSQTQLEKQTVLVSGETYSTFQRKHSEDLEHLKEMFINDWPRIRKYNPNIFASYLYDQIWALALAVNNSLPTLRSKNLDNYTIGQNDITAVIEEQMANLSFQGAGGWVEFNQYRDVSTPVEVYWILDDGKQERVGIYNPLNPSDFHVHINSSKLPNDTLYRRYEFLVVPLSVAIVMYILTGAITVFTTIQLIVYLYYRKHKAIKATSPNISLLMFVGCYLLYLAAVLAITRDSFLLSPNAYTTTLRISFGMTINAIDLILITLFLKLLRINHIFSNSTKLRSHLGKFWTNLSLFFIVILLMLILNVILVIVTALEAPTYDSYTLNSNDLIIQVHIRPITRDNSVVPGVAMVMVSFVILLMIGYLAVRTRKIKYTNFKDTKKINLLIALLVVIGCLTAAAYVILHQLHMEPTGNIILILGILSIPTLCQLILFTPKVVPIVLERCFRKEGSLRNMWKTLTTSTNTNSSK